MNCEWHDKIFEAGTTQNFEELALELFRLQFAQNIVYRQYCEALTDPGRIKKPEQIPFLPVSFFKTHRIVTGSFESEAVFGSSGTTGTGSSRHEIRSLELYRESFLRGFRLFYGEPRAWCIAALLPSYLERDNSSLVYMAKGLIEASGDPRSSFYLRDFPGLISLIRENEAVKRKTLLVGVTFALLDLAEQFREPLQHTVVMETGGMKGRRKELVREEVHELLQSAWGLDAIHSEYGMTELLSQAYALRGGIFRSPPWMRVYLRAEDDPLATGGPPAGGASTGLINIIDLANIHSCAFIATDDMGRLHADGSFEVTGRADASDLRGCSLLYV